MKCVAWNCMGCNDLSTPTIPYILWMIRNFRLMFCFIFETKSTVDRISSLLNSSNLSFVVVLLLLELLEVYLSSGGLYLICLVSMLLLM